MNDLINTDSLTNLQIGRLESVINKHRHFDGRATTFNRLISELKPTSKHVTNKTEFYSWKKYKNMFIDEQIKYEKKLMNTFLYYFSYVVDHEMFSVEIPKILFDALVLEDITKESDLSRRI